MKNSKFKFNYGEFFRDVIEKKYPDYERGKNAGENQFWVHAKKFLPVVRAYERTNDLYKGLIH